MRTIIVLLLSISAAMQTYSQNSQDRQPVAAGRFYPADKATLMNEISSLFSSLKTKPEPGIRALVVPHAGYVYSGKTAAMGYSMIPRNAGYKNIFIIGSSHIMAFGGASIYYKGDFLTPLGRVKVNKEISEKLTGENKVFDFPDNCHLQEHSIEVQLPILQYYLGDGFQIIPVIIGTDDLSKIKEIAKALKPWFTKENLFIVSSDFSHYPSYDEAVKTDRETAQSFITGNPSKFLATIKTNSNKSIPGLLTSMCGWTSGLTLLYLAEDNKQLAFKEIDYTNSGDAPIGSKKEVVGYNAIALTDLSIHKDSKESGNSEFSFNTEEKAMLFNIAHGSINTMLKEKKKMLLDESKMDEKLKMPGGVFVTLKINGSLRGCIGRFISTEPLYKVVQESALSSAFEDPRFSPLTREEYSKTEMEITVLGPLRKISSPNEIILGKHGIYIKNGLRSGTMLPQVATENGWTVEQFLGYTSRDKAGIGWDGWKDAELYIYDGLVLEEN